METAFLLSGKKKKEEGGASNIASGLRDKVSVSAQSYINTRVLFSPTSQRSY